MWCLALHVLATPLYRSHVACVHRACVPQYCDGGSLAEAVERGVFWTGHGALPAAATDLRPGPLVDRLSEPLMGQLSGAQLRWLAIYQTLLEIAAALRYLHSLSLVSGTITAMQMPCSRHAGPINCRHSLQGAGKEVGKGAQRRGALEGAVLAQHHQSMTRGSVTSTLSHV